MGALNPLVAGVALKLEASKTAEIDSRAIERATCSAQPRIELFCCFFIDVFPLVFGFFSCDILGNAFLAAAQKCFCPVKRKPRLKPARFFFTRCETGGSLVDQTLISLMLRRAGTKMRTFLETSSPNVDEC